MDYFENPLMPGKKFFRCDRLSASLQVSSCAGMWKDANGPKACDRLLRCKGCRIGARHAGVEDVSTSPVRGLPMCVRCNRTGMRLINGLVCVSCKNREYEWRKGKNAKGVYPSHYRGLERVKVRYVSGGMVRTLEREAVGVAELVAQVLRDSEKRVMFGMGVGVCAKSRK